MHDLLAVDNPVRIGIIGGGQLGKMLAQEAKRMSFNVIILDPTPDCPASVVSDRQIIADFKDESAIKKLATESDVITYEIELGNSDILMHLESEGHTVHPSAETLRTIQDKLQQKRVLRKNAIPVPDFEEITSEKSLFEALEKFGYPAVLKARRDSYDGRGNFVINSKNDMPKALEFVRDRQCFLERFVRFTKEVSIMIARNATGQIASFPLVENIHKDHVLYMTIAPARVSNAIKQKAKKIATKTMKTLKGSGIFGIEMFVTRNGDVLINEIAPRPHNSGHYTIEACNVSQFEQHIRAILDLPLLEPRLLSPAAMINILGEEDCEGTYAIKGIKEMMTIPGAKVHIYGKKISKRGRKIGHITVTDRTIAGAIAKARKARKMIKVLDSKVVKVG
ncbi:MAG TPA: 5-(carboxyamino)imidazole ribonucleotide synthase [Nitrososphaerales archaeon]|nr:5-(carboxyamino)imidazole ribonucleotide synthase [Nitrososphaerales archaeon]